MDNELIDDKTDWELLNGYADDELSAVERLETEQRLINEPPLSEMLESIQHAKNSMALLKTLQEPQTVVPITTKRPVLKRLALAASLALSVLGAGSLYFNSQETTLADAALESHISLSQNNYVVDKSFVQPASLGISQFDILAPNLTGARLQLVDIKQGTYPDGKQITMHYRGVRGCSLSIIVQRVFEGMKHTPLTLASDVMMHTWNDKKYRFVILAKGMDMTRFETIKAYSQDVIKRQLHNDGKQFAGVVSNENAPCV